MTALHLTQNTDRIHVVQDETPVHTMLFSMYDTPEDAIDDAIRILFIRAGKIELAGERLKVSFIIQHD